MDKVKEKNLKAIKSDVLEIEDLCQIRTAKITIIKHFN